MSNRLLSLWVIVCVLGGACTLKAERDDAERGLSFIEDDYPAAVALARERNVPLFVDAWAPWCHTCVFMREHVLKAPELSAHQKRFVFLAIDTEKEKNAPFLAQYPVEVWPTLFVVDAKREAAVLKWLGSGTAQQLEKLFDDGERAARNSADDAEPLRLLAEADRLYAERKDSADAYRAALKVLPADHPRRARAIESLLNTLYGSKKLEECAAAGVQYAPTLNRGPSFVNTVALSLSCASMAEERAPWRAGAVSTLVPLAEESLRLEGILADDKSGVYELLVELQGAGGTQLAVEWLEFLEAEAAKASTPAARAVFDPHRVNAARAAKQPLRAEAALLQSEKDLPSDYNPPARLAMIYRDVDRFPEALAAAERALSKAYGPRKIRVYEIKASIQRKMNDGQAQKATLLEGIRYGQSLPESQRAAPAVGRLQAELNKVDAK